MVHAGNLVRANDTTPLVVINQVTPIYVTFAIPEARLAELKRYMAEGSLNVEAPAAERRPAPPSIGPDRLRRQPGRSDDRHDQDQGHVPERGSPALARQFVNVRSR